MLGTVRDLERAASMPVEPVAVDDAKAPAAEDVEGLFAVDVPPGVPADRNLCLQNTASHSGKPELIRNHQLDPSILPRTHPWNTPVVGNHGRTTELLLNSLACCQPFIVESRHRVVLTLCRAMASPFRPRAERPDVRRSHGQ